MAMPAGKPILICFDNSAGARRAIETAPRSVTSSSGSSCEANSEAE